MKICHVCKAECEDSADLCPVCGAILSENGDENTVKEITNPTLLASVEDVVSAEILEDILTDNGIMFSDNSAEVENSMRVTFGGGFVSLEIYVDDSDYEKAKELYEEFLASEENNEFFFDDEFAEEETEEDI